MKQIIEEKIMCLKSSVNRKYAQAGFTLIELLVTISIVAILASLAMPSFTQMIENSRVGSITNRFMGSFNYARNEAVTRNQSVVICAVDDPAVAVPQCITAGSEWSDGWMVFVDTNGNEQLGAGELLLRVFEAIPERYTLTNNDNARWARFDTRGLVTFNSGRALTFTVTPPSGEASPTVKRMVIAWAGRIKLED
jgi:type IV fimbrial biogenesis protein FimT